MQVRQVERVLQRHYLDENLIEAGDLENQPDEERNQRLLSRALTAQAVRIVTGFNRADAALTVIDGRLDQGIDAIAVVHLPEPHVYIVQGKWSKNGKARAESSAVQAMAKGLRLIDDEAYAKFNPRGQELAQDASDLIGSGPVRVTQVYALMRDQPVSEEFASDLDVIETEFNAHGERLDHRILLAPEIWESVRRDLAPTPITIQATLAPWFTVADPHVSYQGVVTAEEVAGWFDNGPDLFNLNIRSPLGRTPINNELAATLTDDPESFWYLNNGVTILCEKADRVDRSMRSPHDHPLRLTLHGASVVNGAQTVRTVAETFRANDEIHPARIGVRIIVTDTADEFARRITQATNRQNRVEPRDFIALDPVQAAIAEEMRAELDLEYSVRRSELEPQPETGCSVVEAAVALVCLHTDSRYTARIVSSLEPLWDRSPAGIYQILFNPQPNVYQLWRAVLVHRAVRRALATLRGRYQGRAIALIDNGTNLLAHLTFRRLDPDSNDEPGPAEDRLAVELEQVPDIVGDLFPAVMEAIDSLYKGSPIRAVCTDADRCREIVEWLKDDAAAPANGADASRYRRRRDKPKRRPNAVQVLLDDDVLDEGESLTLTSGSAAEKAAMNAWLAADLSRSRATWVPNRSKSILWAADGKQYSPSGLISHMWELAGWEGHPVAAQGTARWATRSGDTLADLARKILDDREAAEDPLGVDDGQLLAFVEAVASLVLPQDRLNDQIDNNAEDQFLRSVDLHDVVLEAVVLDDGAVLNEVAFGKIARSFTSGSEVADEIVRKVGERLYRARRGGSVESKALFDR